MHAHQCRYDSHGACVCVCVIGAHLRPAMACFVFPRSAPTPNKSIQPLHIVPRAICSKSKLPDPPPSAVKRPPAQPCSLRRHKRACAQPLFEPHLPSDTVTRSPLLSCAHTTVIQVRVPRACLCPPCPLPRSCARPARSLDGC